jgi:hypothetical protein
VAAYWLLRCIRSHQKCRFIGTELPTRVIDVAADSPFIHETARGERGKYCTLSYRWTPQAVTTTQENLAQFKRSIPLDLLPQVILDAINVTRKLGIQYLWVDALCILHGSASDKQAEVANMHSIYRNSLLTIAAVDSSTGADGILKPRNESQPRPKSYIRPHGVLDTRGWALQEQLLSPRVLSYVDGQLFWDCLTLSASESCPTGFQPELERQGLQPREGYLTNQLIHNLRNFLTMREPYPGSLSSRTEDEAYWYWRAAVIEFTRRDLSDEKDCWSAILGVASTLSRVLHDRLLAGLWDARFIDHLAWRAEPRPRRNNQFASTSRRPRKFQAPTWSWLSVLGPITYDALAMNPRWPLQESGFEPATTFGGAEIEERMVGETLTILGRVQLTGPMMKAYIRPSFKNVLFLGPGACNNDVTSNREGHPNNLPRLPKYKPPFKDLRDKWEVWYPDDDQPSNNEIFCLYLGDGSNPYIPGPRLQYTLCLVPTGRAPKEFQRVGICGWNPMHFQIRDPYDFSYNVDVGVTLEHISIV